MRRTTALMGGWQADTQSGENLHFELCKGGYFSNKEEYGLKVVGKAFQDGTPSPDTPIPIQCVKQGTKISCCGNNLIDNTKIDGTYTTYANPAHSLKKQLFMLEKGKTYYYGMEMNGDIGALPSMLGRIIAYTSGNKSTLLDIVPNRSFTVKNDLNADTVANVYVYGVAGTGYSCTFSNAYIVEGNQPTIFEPYVSGGEITTPCDLYEGDIWYPMSGMVKRNSRILYNYGGETVDSDFFSTTGGLTVGAKVVCMRETPVMEYYNPQIIFALQGTVNVLQNPLELNAELAATMLVK